MREGLGFKQTLKKWETISHFKRYSLFFRFYLLLLLLVTIIIVSFSFYISRIIGANAQKQYDQMNQQMLTRTVNQIDTSVFFLNQILSIAGNNKYVVDAAIRPGINFNERNQNVATSIKEITKSNAFIEETWLYEKTGNIVFTSDGMVTSLEDYAESGDLPAVLALLEEGDMVILQGTEKSRACITHWDGDVYVVYESLAAQDGSFLSKLVARLNTGLLFQNATEEITDLGDGIVVRGSGDVQLFTNLPDPVSEKQAKQEISCTSGITKFSFSLYPNAYEAAGWWFILRQILPFLLLMTVGSLVLALAVAEKMYSPISSLTNRFWKKRAEEALPPAPGKRRDEIDFLYQTYAELLQDKERAEYLIQDARPELERRLFLDLISGAEMSDGQLKQQLENIYSSFRADGTYVVMMIYFADLDEMENMVSYLSMREIERGITAIFPSEQGQVLYVPKNDYGIIVTQFSGEYTQNQAAIAAACFEEQVQAMLRKQGVEGMSACGKPCRGLREMPSSYAEAYEKLRRQVYFQNEPAVEMEEEEAYAEDAHTHCFDQLRSLTEQINKNDMPAAETSLKGLLAGFHGAGTDLAFQKYFYEQLLDMLIGRSLQFPGEQACCSSEDYQEMYRVLQASTSQEELARYVDEAVDRLFAFIKAQSLRRQNRIVTKAREYIADNYDNGDLSVQMIAENIGISASYLSNLFTTHMGESLVSYINEYRVNVAIHLLRNTTISIKEIGYRTGFNTAQNFNRVFKRFTGKTPGRYREQGLD